MSKKPRKRASTGKVTKRAQQQAKARGLKHLTADGCFLAHEENDNGGPKTAGAAVICDANDKIEKIICFSLNHLDIQDSTMAELWAFAIILNHMPKDSIGQITFDNPAVNNAITRVRTGKTLKHDWDTDLKAKLTSGVERQPNMNPNKKTRNQGKIEIADSYAKAAAGGKKYDLNAVSRKFGSHPHEILELTNP